MDNSPRRPPVPPLLVIAVGILAVSTASIFIRFAQRDAPSLVVAAYRLSFAALLLTPLALGRRRAEWSRLGRADLAKGALSGVFLALHFASWITSLEFTSVTSSVVLVTTTPLWVGLASPLLLGERLGGGMRWGMALALLGGIVVGISDSCAWGAGGLDCPSLPNLLGGQAMWGNFLALFGAWMAAGYLLVGRQLRSKLSLVGYISLVYGIAAVILVGMALAAGFSLLGYPAQTFLWFLLLALLPQLVGHSSFNYALAYLPAAFVSVTLLGEPIGSTILAFFLLNEAPSALKMFGAILILIGIYLAAQADVKIR
jgi:drug/metabolite transporter (DMT)-like permease